MNKIVIFLCETACLFAVIFNTARPKRQADGWLAKSLMYLNVLLGYP